MEKIYVDNAATTAVCDEAIDAMMHHFKVNYGNPSSVHAIGQNAAKSLKSARDTIAECIGAQSNEIYLTSGGTEADNWAIKFAAADGAKKGKKHIITSKFEHHAVLHTLQALEKDGFEITYLDVYSDGIVKPEDVKNAIRSDTALVTIMYANNEIGTIQPIAEIGKVCRESGVLFHTDAVQAVGHVPINVNDQYIDMLSMASHKFHGPKGIGALYCRKGLQLNSLFYGGTQESGKRAGTENVAGAVGMATALKKSCDEMEESNKRIIYLRDKLINELLKIPYTRLNGNAKLRLPGNVNLSFEGVEGESLLLSLDMYGICASSGSACTSGSLDPSHVLLAIGLTHEVAHGSLRLTLSPYNTEEEIDFIIKTIPSVIERLRDMSPVWERMMKGAN